METQTINESLDLWEQRFVHYFITSHELSDASHDLSHFRRVYCTAKQIAIRESAPVDAFVILAAAYFHDVVSLPKNHPDNKMSSRYAASKAKEILLAMDFPSKKLEPTCHAIVAHSFSAQVPPETIEAKIIQDADRMESLGALGAMRTFYVSGRIGRDPYDPQDLYAERRPLDDKIFALDHFFVKLFKLPGLLQTEVGRSLAEERVRFLHDFVKELDRNINAKKGGALCVVNACCQAGSQSSFLFDTSDPLAKNRPMNPAQFVIDHLIESRSQFPFINQFLDQFSLEVT